VNLACLCIFLSHLRLPDKVYQPLCKLSDGSLYGVFMHMHRLSTEDTNQKTQQHQTVTHHKVG